MACREYMIDYREKRSIDLQTMAIVCNTSKTLLDLLECDESVVTHPHIAERIGQKYKMTPAQIEGLIPENYRKSSPHYNPNLYRAKEDAIDE